MKTTLVRKPQTKLSKNPNSLKEEPKKLFTVTVNPYQNQTEDFDLSSIIDNFFRIGSVEDYLSAHAPTIYGLPFPLQKLLQKIVREINLSIFIHQWEKIEYEPNVQVKSQIFWESTIFTQIDDAFLQSGVVTDVESKVGLFSFWKMWNNVVARVDAMDDKKPNKQRGYEMPNPYDGIAFSIFCQVIRKRLIWWRKFKNVALQETLKVEAKDAENYLFTVFARVMPLSWAIIKFFVERLFKRSHSYTLEREKLKENFNKKWTNFYEVWQIGLTSVFSAKPFEKTHLIGVSSLYVLYNNNEGGQTQEVILLGSEASTEDCQLANLVHPTTTSAIGWISSIQKKYAYHFWDILYPEETFSKSVTLKSTEPKQGSFAAWQEFRNHKRTKANSRNFELNFGFKEVFVFDFFHHIYTTLNTIVLQNSTMTEKEFTNISEYVNKIRSGSFNFDVYKNAIREGWENYKKKKLSESESESEKDEKTERNPLAIGEEETFKSRPLKNMIFDFSNFKSVKEKPDKFLEFLKLKTTGSYFSAIFKKKIKHQDYMKFMIQFLKEFFTQNNKSKASVSTWTSLNYLLEQFLSPFFNFSVLYALLYSPKKRSESDKTNVEETDFPWVNRTSIPTNIIIWTSVKHATLVHAFLKNQMGFASDEEKTYAKAVGTAIASVWSAKTAKSDVCLDIAQQGVDLRKLKKFIENRDTTQQSS